MNGAARLQLLVLLNLVIVAIQPVILVFTGYFAIQEVGAEAVSDLGWGAGIVLTWALFPAVIFVLGHIREQRPPRWQQSGFILMSFVLPLIVAIARGDSVLWVLFDLASFHTLGIGLAVGATLLLGPVFEIDIAQLRLDRIRLRRPRQILELCSPIPIMLLVNAFLLPIALLGPLAAEVLFVRHGGYSPVALVLRYAMLGPETSVLWGLFLARSIYAPSPSRAGPPNDPAGGPG